MGRADCLQARFLKPGDAASVKWNLNERNGVYMGRKRETNALYKANPFWMNCLLVEDGGIGLNQKRIFKTKT